MKKLTLDKGEKIVVNINRLKLLEDVTGNQRWTIMFAGLPIEDANNPEFAVVGTAKEDIVFSIVDDSDFPISSP